MDSSSSKLLVLIVDDEKMNRRLVRAQLERMGHDVIEAGDGAQGVEVFRRESPDIVIMDMMMPVLDGYEATLAIKDLCGDRFLPVIFLTANTDEEALAHCIEVVRFSPAQPGASKMLGLGLFQVFH